MIDSSSCRILNLGILAHVDAGKTSLTERLLYSAGVVGEIGSVDAGNTITDSLDLERQRGITIKSAVVSFQLADVTVNLIDTPGHPDFIAEVERVLNVLDGAVLVISAVEGVQPQTRILMRTLQRLRIPTLIFINKIDRAGARNQSLLDDIAGRLSPAIVAMGAPEMRGSRDARYLPYGSEDEQFLDRLASVLADGNDLFLEEWLAGGGRLPWATLQAELVRQTADCLVHPVFFGSAITGAGIEELIDGITTLLPAVTGDEEAPLSAAVFKVDRGQAGEKIAFVRVFTGSIHLRDRPETANDQQGKVTAISLFADGRQSIANSLSAGRIGTIVGMPDIRIGDVLGQPRPDTPEHHFAPPTLETVIAPVSDDDRGLLQMALSQLAEQDPLINLRQNDIRQELYLSLYGEVQKEVIESTLATDFGVAVEFRETLTICIERPVGCGAAVSFDSDEDNPFLATIGLRIDPLPEGSGIRYGREIEVHGTMPPAFFTAIEDSVHEVLQQGLNGWQVTDCQVTLTHTGYWPRQSARHAGFDKSISSTGADFRGLTPLVLMDALQQAGVEVLEPLHQFEIVLPARSMGGVLPLLARLQAVSQTRELSGETFIIEGEIPAARIHELQLRLPGLTGGEGVLEFAFERYQLVHGTAPSRPRWDHNPLDRKEYLLHVTRKV